MRIALYTGKHAGSPWNVRLGGWIIRLAQKGALGNVSHVEAILTEYPDGSVDIASSVAMDGGVRIKRTTLVPAEWRIVDVPEWDAAKSRAWFMAHAGEPYDWLGAIATMLPGHSHKNHWFCDGSVGASVGVIEPQTFTPATFAALCLTFGREVTHDAL
jgi:hypothetical protein